MREIKFRQPIYENGKVVSWHFWGVGIEQGGELANVGWLTSKLFVTNPKDSQQFTGLKDKNGKEIYEGDIVEFPDYRNGAWFGKPQPTRIEVVEYSTYFSAYQELRMYEQLKDRYEVIGNIYENPELLTA